MIKVVMALAVLRPLTGGAGEISNDRRPVMASAIVNPYADDARAIENGEKLFGRVSCHGCHGSNARGGNGPDLTDDEWLRAPRDGMIFKAIKFGR